MKSVSHAACNVFAAGFLEFDSVEGESGDANHDKWIDVLAWTFETESQQGPSRRCGPISRSLSFTKWVNTSSPEIMRLVETCEEQSEVVLEVAVRESDSQPGVQRIMRVRMQDVTVSRVVMRDGADDVAPTETVELRYSHAEIEFVEVGGGGPEIRD